jgi:hypothetical protein
VQLSLSWGDVADVRALHAALSLTRTARARESPGGDRRLAYGSEH